MKPILLAHSDPEVLQSLTSRLSDLGYEVVGVARTAGVALALAARSWAPVALVGEGLAGRRHGRELRQALRETWGIRCARWDGQTDADLVATVESAR